jgi:hypothetical protein
MWHDVPGVRPGQLRAGQAVCLALEPELTTLRSRRADEVGSAEDDNLGRGEEELCSPYFRRYLLGACHTLRPAPANRPHRQTIHFLRPEDENCGETVDLRLSAPSLRLGKSRQCT